MSIPTLIYALEVFPQLKELIIQALLKAGKTVVEKGQAYLETDV
jgi:hypothetical protein